MMAADEARTEDEYVQPVPGGAGVRPPIMVTSGPRAVMDYMCKLNIPEEYKEEWANWIPLLSESLQFANILRSAIPHYMDYLELIAGWYRIGRPSEAREYMLQLLFELSLTSSVDGFKSKVVVTSRMEQSLEGFGPREEKKKKRFWIF